MIDCNLGICYCHDGEANGAGHNEGGAPGSVGGGSDSADPLGARRKKIAFAEQGCEMISWISLVLSGTIDSAEKRPDLKKRLVKPLVLV
jgi:hypothetical protein